MMMARYKCLICGKPAKWRIRWDSCQCLVGEERHLDGTSMCQKKEEG